MCIGPKIVPVRKNCTVVRRPWHANVNEVVDIVCVELSVAIRGYIDAVVGHSAGSKRKGKRDGGYPVIIVITYVI